MGHLLLYCKIVTMMQLENKSASTAAAQGFNWHAVSDFSNLTPGIKSHLVKVYQTLFATIACTAVGVYAHMVYNIGGLLTMLATLGCVMGVYGAQKIDQKFGFLMGVGFLQGASLGPLIKFLLELDPTYLSTIFTALAATSVVFACFSLSALWAERRSWLFIGGFLSSAMTLLFFLGLMNMFVPTPAVMNARIYLGLMVFCGYVIFDTQLIVEKASLGSTDYVGDALVLFLDFIAIFVRILIILAKNKESNKKKNQR